MNKSIKPFALFLLLTLTSCGGQVITSSSSSEEKETNSSKDNEEKLKLNQEVNLFTYTFPSLDRTTMPISGWCSPWSMGDKDYINQEQFAMIKEAGLNSIYGLYETAGLSMANIKRALKLAEDNGLVYLPRDERVGALSEDIDAFKEAMDEFTSYKSYGGSLITDEPALNKFQGLVSGRKAFRSYYSKYCYYVNLFPNYATSDQLSGIAGQPVSYEQYLESFLKTVQPQVLSFDFYGLRKEFPSVSGGYFDQLYLASKLANKYKVPFWPFIQAGSFDSWTVRVPTKVEIDWQIGSNLVYGAKGIQYFCYMTPYEVDDALWRGNFVNKNGEKTELFPYFQSINKQIASMDEILMISSRVALMQFGSSPAAFSNEQKAEFVTSFRELKNVDTESDLLIGVFDHGGKSAYYVFNNSLTNKGKAKLNFSSYVRANKYQNAYIEEVKGSSLELDLEPGESILIDLLNYEN